MKILKIILSIMIILLTTGLNSFPGEHNSLTCDKNFEGLAATIDSVPNTIITDVNEKDSNKNEIPNTGILGKYYRRAADGLGANPNVGQNYANIVSAINSDIALPNSFVKDKLRRNRNFALHATIWGDSLSDFVQFYGIIGPAYSYYPF